MASCGYRNRPLRLPHALRYGELSDGPKKTLNRHEVNGWTDAHNPKQVSVVSAREGDFGAKRRMSRRGCWPRSSAERTKTANQVV